jgi:hypothetical protein
MKGVEFERGGGGGWRSNSLEELASMMTWTMTAPTTTRVCSVLYTWCVLCILNNNNIMYILLASILLVIYERIIIIIVKSLVFILRVVCVLIMNTTPTPTFLRLDGT